MTVNRRWLIALFVLALGLMIAGRWPETLIDPGVFQYLLLAVLLSPFTLSRQIVHFVSFALLIVLVSLGLFVQLLNVDSWETGIANSLMGAFQEPGITTIPYVGKSDWHIPATVEAVNVEFRTRLVTGELDNLWFRSTPEIRFEYAPHESDQAFVRVTFPLDGNPYIMRTYDFGEALGGNTFRASVELRSDSNVPVQTCRGLWLQVWEDGGGRVCGAAVVGPRWEPHSIEWSVPDRVSTSWLRIVLNGFDGYTIDVRNVELSQLVDGSWQEVNSHLAPAAPYLQVVWNGEPSDSTMGIAIPAEKDWVHSNVTLSVPNSTEANELSLRLRVGTGQESVDLAASPPSVTTVDSPLSAIRLDGSIFGKRNAYIFGHPNFAAHTITMLGLISIGTAISTQRGKLLVILLLAITGVLLTGSRAGMLVVIAFIPTVIALRTRGLPRAKWAIVFLIALIVIVLFSVDSRGTRPTPSTEMQTSRGEIWKTATNAISMYPSSPRDAIATFLTAFEAGERPTHAHNFWLEMGLQYGITGLMGSVVLSGVLLYVAAIGHGTVGLVFMLAVFCFQVFDYSLPFYGVFYAMLMYLLSRPPQSDGARRQAVGLNH